MSTFAMKSQMICNVMQLQRKKHIFYLERIAYDPKIYIHWTIPSLLHQTRSTNPLVYKGLNQTLPIDTDLCKLVFLSELPVKYEKYVITGFAKNSNKILSNLG